MTRLLTTTRILNREAGKGRRGHFKEGNALSKNEGQVAYLEYKRKRRLVDEEA